MTRRAEGKKVSLITIDDGFTRERTNSCRSRCAPISAACCKHSQTRVTQDLCSTCSQNDMPRKTMEHLPPCQRVDQRPISMLQTHTTYLGWGVVHKLRMLQLKFVELDWSWKFPMQTIDLEVIYGCPLSYSHSCLFMHSNTSKPVWIVLIILLFDESVMESRYELVYILLQRLLLLSSVCEFAMQFEHIFTQTFKQRKAENSSK